MAHRTDINKILIIGSGPIIIGQACEFDYSGTQACKALRKLGHKIVLVNSNPATIMTDPGIADATYIEPLNVARLTSIIAKERPDAILPNLGGQTALNLCCALEESGVLEKYGVEVIGVSIDTIRRGEDRLEFKLEMAKLGIEMARSEVIYTLDDALAVAGELGYPVVLRPAFTMGGTGGGLVCSDGELKTVCARGLKASPVHQVLVEESVLGWEELELEVIRDADGRMITVCFIENIDPLGIHTGDSFCCAPMLTVSQELQARMQEQAYRIVDSIGVVGGTNIQFAHDPQTDRLIVIEINPRTSRSSALASKATGFPIALVSAMLATGVTLDEIPCGKHGTLDKYVPGGDYVVVKFARWAFEKFRGIEDLLGTQMRAVGEVMSIGKTYKEAFQKAIRSLESGRSGLGNAKGFDKKTKAQLLEMLRTPTSERQYILYEALRKGADVEELYQLTKIKPWFLEQMKELAAQEESLQPYIGKIPPADILAKAKKSGFSDLYLARILDTCQQQVREHRIAAGLTEGYEKIHVCGTPDSYYLYSTYHSQGSSVSGTGAKKVLVLGGGPNRIGQGIEFDYCCVHAAQALKALGLSPIMVNCNPETVSTDYDTSDTLYFEPLTAENVLGIYSREKPAGAVVQFGGQTPLNIAKELEANGVNILGTAPAIIDMAEDRGLFGSIMEKLGIPMPESGMAETLAQALETAEKIGYPVIVRPSYVLGGRGMEIVYDGAALSKYMALADVAPGKPVLIDRFLDHATECETDAICDGVHAFIPAVMEHVELAGVHSGDSACIIPPVSIPEDSLQIIRAYTRRIAEALGVRGLMNMQFAIENGKVFVLEANPRASRTVPLISKVCATAMVAAAVEIITSGLTGRGADLSCIEGKRIPYYGVKEAVLPFNMFPETDPQLGPEMRSTGEVLGIADTYEEAFLKAEEATKTPLPSGGTALISISDRDKADAMEAVGMLSRAGFSLLATAGTCDMINEAGYHAVKVNRIGEDRPNILDLIESGSIQLIVNTASGSASRQDGSLIRKAAVRENIPYITTIAAAKISAKSILAAGKVEASVPKSLQELHMRISNKAG